MFTTKNAKLASTIKGGDDAVSYMKKSAACERVICAKIWV